MKDTLTNIGIFTAFTIAVAWFPAAFATSITYGLPLRLQLPWARGWSHLSTDGRLEYVIKHGARATWRSPTAIYWWGSDRTIERAVAAMLAEYLTHIDAPRIPSWVADDFDTLCQKRPAQKELPAFVVDRKIGTLTA